MTEAPLPDIEVLGIDETRRGRARWEKDPQTGKWSAAADRWHTGFVDAAGCGGLLGQIEGRATGDVLAWPADTPLTWRQGVRFVAIDMSPLCRAAIRTGLPQATVVVDHFHVVQLANKMLNLVRRRLTRTHRGRRGRATEWKARRKLLRNREDLTDAEFERMWNPLMDQGPIGQALLVARDRSLPEHRHQQRQERGDQPRDQVRRPLRLRLPQPDQPAPPSTLRHHPPSPRTPPHRITSKTRFRSTSTSAACAALETSTVPVLLVHGTHGFLAPETIGEFRARVPRAEIVEIEAGHNVQEQQPAALAAATSRFLPGPTDGTA
ncbi:hypothetical protein FMEAI12_3350003 [Parafrankia sp. Ea1.12]|nr:hypothetical protein FMEAI12_3350003 [Parafrankia sp. Ea1.12]